MVERCGTSNVSLWSLSSYREVASAAVSAFIPKLDFALGCVSDTIECVGNVLVTLGISLLPDIYCTQRNTA